MAGLATAFELTTGDWRRRYESVTVYQRGWRLGGKGASSRGPNGRIEEHGLHVLLGYYHETFRMMRACYDELDRARTDPECPLKTWDDAVTPSARVGLTEFLPDGSWMPWTMEFPERRIGQGGGRSRGVGAAVQLVRLLVAFIESAQADPAGGEAEPSSTGGRVSARLRSLGLAGLVAVAEQGAVAAESIGPELAAALRRALGPLRRESERAVASVAVGPVIDALVDIVLTNLAGLIRDRVLIRPEGLEALDDLDYREWLRRHGAKKATLDCGLLRGMYDLVFAYEDADRSRPRFAAGLGLDLSLRMLTDYSGSVFWKMEAGMGEVIFAPLFEMLERRGVRFEFFHRVDELVAEAGAVSRVVIGRQAEVSADFDPLVRVHGLPAWPADPPHALLEESGPWLRDAESHSAPRNDVAVIELEAGRDFDVVVFAASIGMVPEVCPTLIAADARWQAMVDHVGTVATQAFQVWTTPTSEEMGWSLGHDVTLSGYVEPFDTWADMSHLIERESWDGNVGSIAYFCGSLGDEDDVDVREAAMRFLEESSGVLWPNVAAAGSFDWDALVAPPGESGAARFDHQYWRANRDLSDRYVQSLPGTNRYRLAPSDSGFANLVLAGDWTDTGLNAGCVEAATLSGVLAAAAVADLVLGPESRSNGK